MSMSCASLSLTQQEASRDYLIRTVSLTDCISRWRVLRLRTIAREVECQVVLNYSVPS